MTVSVDARSRYEDEDRMSPEEFWGTNRDGRTVEGEATGEGALLACEIELK